MWWSTQGLRPKLFSTANTNAAMSRYEIFRSGNLYAYLNGGDWPSPVLLVAFDHWRPVQDHAEPGFAEEFAVANGIDVLSVRCATNAWWQYPEMPEALTVIAGFAADWDKIVTYGSSMGGYAALRYASALNAARAIAISPQYSIDPAKAPWEDRYDKEAGAIDFSRETAITPGAGFAAVVVFDPINPCDARHVARIRQDIALDEVKFPISGHPSFEFLKQIGIVAPVALGLIEGRYDRRKFRILSRMARRTTRLYWHNLTWMLEIHGHFQAAIDTELILASMQDNKPAAYAKAVGRAGAMGQKSFIEKCHLVPAADRALLLAAARAAQRQQAS